MEEKKMDRGTKLFWLIFFALLAAAWVASNIVAAPDMPTPKRQAVPGGFAKTKGPGFVAARDYKYLNKMTELAVQHDYKAMDSMVVWPHAFYMKKGVKVKVVGSKYLGTYLKFRVMGESQAYWTVKEALRRVK